MNVAEIFQSINGEGPKAGELALFVRFTGCNLHCTYCDTDWAISFDAAAKSMRPTDIAEIVAQSGMKNVTLTGGEPLLQKDMPRLLALLHQLPKLRVEVETNGSVDLAPFCNTDRPFFTMDYKLPGSGFEGAMRVSNFSLLNREDCVKFVCSSEFDVLRAFDLIHLYHLSERTQVHLSPVFGQLCPDRMVALMQSHRMTDVRLQLQMHKLIWDPNMRGV